MDSSSLICDTFVPTKCQEQRCFDMNLSPNHRAETQSGHHVQLLQHAYPLPLQPAQLRLNNDLSSSAGRQGNVSRLA